MSDYVSSLEVTNTRRRHISRTRPLKFTNTLNNFVTTLSRHLKVTNTRHLVEDVVKGRRVRVYSEYFLSDNLQSQIYEHIKYQIY